MKVESISIQNFKLFENLEVSFKNPILDEVSNRFLILGDNGTGKTTLLQAIALPLALATRQISSVADFNWVGFLPSRYWKWGTPKIELIVSFEEQEIQATQEIAEQWYEAQPETFKSKNSFLKPGNSKSVRLILEGDYWEAGTTDEERLQFQGRYYTQWLVNRGEQSYRSHFSKLPGIFWFDQFRNLASNTYKEKNGDGWREPGGGGSFEVGIGSLRQYLIQWKYKQDSTQKGSPDDYWLMELEKLYKKIFSDRSFWGVEQMPKFNSPTEQESYFVLNDGNRTYDIVEMSAGEQQIFPILYAFIRQKIDYSVVLIDEIDLNLHPPLAQFLVGVLRKIKPTCQFIFTTHSEAVRDLISKENTYRLKGGSLCL
ncbi:MAG: AAA family ATPase [Okeania sp. SIO2H7]|nr:AAA family ATPase [Okeania sp. SIO2H7]